MGISNRALVLTLAVLSVVTTTRIRAQDIVGNEPPVADAGPWRYTMTDPVQLDGTGSYDPDQSGTLEYTWAQVAGPTVAISDANTATPTISGSKEMAPRGGIILGPFVQTDEPQMCEFELVVSDGEVTSAPDRVKVIIVPSYGFRQLRPYGVSTFDPNKPTIVYFGGGDCTNGLTGDDYVRLPFQSDRWIGGANILWLPSGYSPDSRTGNTYYKYGDMLILYLAEVAPQYTQSIQTSGWSTGGQPAVDVGVRLNESYQDPRYRVNRVTLLDAAPYCRNYTESIKRYLATRAWAGQCWVDNYVASLSEHNPYDAKTSFPLFHDNVLNVEFEGYQDPDIGWVVRHRAGNDWLGQSLDNDAAMLFNEGAVAGAYLSVIGPGRNLQLASTPDQQLYWFRWCGDSMEMVDEEAFPGRLPEPVRLAAWANVEEEAGRLGGTVLSCHVSGNAIGYELLAGSDPDRVTEYRVISDTSIPPMAVVEGLAPEETWWTIRVRDQYGSTIYADPIPLDTPDLVPLNVHNERTGKMYALIGHAIMEAEPGDTILLAPAVYKEKIIIEKPLQVTSSAPDDPSVAAETIVAGCGDGAPTVAFSGFESTGSMLVGLTIQSPTVGVKCRDACPLIRHCVVDCPNGVSIDFRYGYIPELVDCAVVGRKTVRETPGLSAYWMLDEAEGTVAYDSVGDNDGAVYGDAQWCPEEGRVGGSLHLDGVDDYIHRDFILDPSQGVFSIYAWIKTETPGQVVVSQEMDAGQTNVWLATDASSGSLMTGLMAMPPFIPSLQSEAAVTDGQWHEVGLMRDGQYRYLYVDGLEVARDETVMANVVVPGGPAYRCRERPGGREFLVRTH